MDDPCTELKADTDERRDPPELDDLVPPEKLATGDHTWDDFFDAVLGLGNPTTVGEVTDLAGHKVGAAREYLEWFERMGTVTQITDSPATYERNQEHLSWRRVQQLRNQYDDERLLAFLGDAVKRDESFAEKFDVESPDTITIATRVADTDRSVKTVWREVSARKTTRRRISLLERTLQTDTDGTTGQRTIVWAAEGTVSAVRRSTSPV